MFRRDVLTAFLCTAILAAPGCAIPSGNVLSGKRPSPEQIAMIRPHITTSQEVLSELGVPSMKSVQYAVFAYGWNESATNYFMGALAVFGLICCGAIDTRLDPATEIQYMLLIQFDDSDRVTRIERVTLGSRQDPACRIMEWANRPADR